MANHCNSCPSCETYLGTSFVEDIDVSLTELAYTVMKPCHTCLVMIGVFYRNGVISVQMVDSYYDYFPEEYEVEMEELDYVEPEPEPEPKPVKLKRRRHERNRVGGAKVK